MGYRASMLGMGRAQLWTWNPSAKDSDVNLSLANRQADTTFPDSGAVRGTAGKSAGKWCVTWLVTGTSGGIILGLGNSSEDLTQYPGFTANGVGYDSNNSLYGGSGGSPPGTYTTGDLISVAWSHPDNLAWFGKNGTFMGNPVAGTGGRTLPSGTLYPMAGLSPNRGVRIPLLPSILMPPGFGMLVL